MVGEVYGNSTGFGPSPPLQAPRIVVYTSPDMMSWTNHGLAFTNWSTFPYGTFFTPWVVFNERTQKFVLWFNAYLNGCCDGAWGVATSDDGVRYDVLSFNVSGYWGNKVDGNALFIDDDHTAYLCYTSMSSGQGGHRVSIDKLNADFTASTNENYGLFAEDYVEGAILFKRNGVYYVTYGSCCCFCRGGSGVVVYASTNITGPWVRQPYDVNCQPKSVICGAYGERVLGNLTISAQGIGLSLLPLTDGGVAYLWQGERWLSAAHNDPTCPDECRACSEPANYVKGSGFSYWIPLMFDDTAKPFPYVMPFASFVDLFSLDLKAQ